MTTTGSGSEKKNFNEMTDSFLQAGTRGAWTRVVSSVPQQQFKVQMS